MIVQLRQLANNLIDLIYPPVCPGCRKTLLEPDQFVCSDCQAHLIPLEPPFCQRCGHTLSIDGPKNPDGSCVECPAKPIGFQQARSVMTYEDDVVKELIHLLKYQFITSLVAPLGKMLNDGFEDYYANKPFDCIIPVPLHYKRQREREFNQSELLARQISINHQIPIRNDLVKRIRPTSPQAHLHPQQRQDNVKGAFACVKPNEVAGLNVLVIDDVMTTGATINEVCLEINQHGAKRINALTLARALYVFSRK